MSDAAALPIPLPRGPRLAALFTLILTFLVAEASLTELFALVHPVDAAPAQVAFGFDDPAIRAAQVKVLEATQRAMQVGRELRELTLSALVFSAFVTFALGLMFRRQGPYLKEPVRRLLSYGALVCAVLRAIDGAQAAAAVKRIAPEYADLSKQLLTQMLDGGTAPQGFESFPAMASSFALFGSLLWLFLIAGSFAGMYLYFSSEKVKAGVQAHDQSRLKR